MAQKKLKEWFDKDLAKMLAGKISEIKSDFNSKSFIRNIDRAVPDLELKARVEVMADELHQQLGEPYKQTIQVLLQIMGPENEEETGMFSNFYWLMPVAKYVEKYGLKDFAKSMKAIEEITKRNTSEYTIRPYIEQYPDRTMKRMLQWSTHKNRHIRRLASEGGRPRLPWASKLDQFIDDPSPLIPILENLKDDPSKYVQKSVANCLNDILKDHPDTVKKLIKNWLKGRSKARSWIIRHALRNLIKKEDSWALAILQQLKSDAGV